MAVSACDGVPAFLEEAGEPLRIEPLESGVRRATPDELLQNLRAMIDGNARPAAEPAGRLALRRKRLATIRARLKERWAELKREGDRLRTERLQFEAERSKFYGGREAGADQRTLLANTRDKDADRLNALFGKPARTPTATVPVNALATSSEVKEVGANAAIADSVADYMEQLMGRMRSAETGAALIAQRDEMRPGRRPAEIESPPDSTERPESLSDAAAEASAEIKKARPRPNYHEIRAGVGSLRKIANLSARTAVARHKSRKFRRSVAITLPVLVISFVLARVLFLLGAPGAKFDSQAFGTVMLGVIVLIGLAYSFWKMTIVGAPHVSSIELDRDGVPGAAVFDDATSPPFGDRSSGTG
jgi:hypothetical protein